AWRRAVARARGLGPEARIQQHRRRGVDALRNDGARVGGALVEGAPEPWVLGRAAPLRRGPRPERARRRVPLHWRLHRGRPRRGCVWTNLARPDRELCGDRRRRPDPRRGPVTKTDVFQCWAPPEGRWTPWVKSVLFAHLDDRFPNAELRDRALARLE